MKKTIITDLDGTLLNENGKSDEVIDKGIQSVIASEHELVVASGRTVYGIQECIELWENPIYLILMNGALILDKQRNIIKIQEISKRLLKELFLLSTIFPVDFYSNNKTYTTLSKEEYINTYSKWKLFQRRVTRENERAFFERFVFSANIDNIVNAKILKVNIFCFGDQDEIKSKLDDLNLKELNIIYSDPIIEITNNKADKLIAVQYLVEKLNANNKDVFVFGDSENDIKMLSNFENSYAPQNAKKQILEIVSEVVSPNYEYGVIRKIKQLCGL